jgi:hypothetical protein
MTTTTYRAARKSQWSLAPLPPEPSLNTQLLVFHDEPAGLTDDGASAPNGDSHAQGKALTYVRGERDRYIVIITITYLAISHHRFQRVGGPGVRYPLRGTIGKHEKGHNGACSG